MEVKFMYVVGFGAEKNVAVFNNQQKAEEYKALIEKRTKEVVYCYPVPLMD